MYVPKVNTSHRIKYFYPGATRCQKLKGSLHMIIIIIIVMMIFSIPWFTNIYNFLFAIEGSSFTYT